MYVSGRPDRSLADSEVLAPRMRRRRAFTLVLLTLLVPGSAQLVAGHRQLGRVGIRAWLGVVGLVVVLGLLLLTDRSHAISVIGRAWVLSCLELSSSVSPRCGRSCSSTRGGWVVPAAADPRPPLAHGRDGRAARGHLRRPRVCREQRGRRAPGPGRAVLDAAAARCGQRPLQHAAARRRHRQDRVGTRPDSIQLVSIDAKTGRTVTFGFSRDTENIDFRPGSTMPG